MLKLRSLWFFVLGLTLTSGLAWAGSAPDLAPAFVPAGDEVAVNTGAALDQWAPDVSGRRDGGFAVVWNSKDQVTNQMRVWLRRYFRDGTPVGVEAPASDSLFVGNGHRLAYHDSGNFSVLRCEIDGILYQHIGADGDLVGGQVTIDDSACLSRTLAVTPVTGDQLVMAWIGPGAGVRQVVIDETGTRVTTETGANTTPCPDRNCAPAVAADPSGNYVVVWPQLEDAGITLKVFGRLYAADGSALGGPFQINTSSDDFWKSFVDVAVAADGSFMVVWTNDPLDTVPGLDETEVNGRIFEADGTPRTAEFMLNGYTFRYQRRPRVAANADGSFSVVWQSTDQDGEVGSIAGAVFAPDGTRISQETVINSFTEGQQDDPRISTNGSDFLVVWESEDQDGSGEGVFGQAFRPRDLFDDGFESGSTLGWSATIP